MKKRVILMAIGVLEFSVADSSLIQIIEADNECKSALSKDYRTASTRELQCKTVYALAQKLKKHPSYRDFERIKLLKSIQEKLKMMKSSEKINWVLKDREINKNVEKLQSLIWPSGGLCYFDVEVNGGQISFISAVNKNGTIQLKTQSENLDDSEAGKSVEVCTPDDKCIPINSNSILLKNEPYHTLKILTTSGKLSYDFKNTAKQNLVRIAYEVYAQLYNKNLPSLSKLKIRVEKKKAKKLDKRDE